MPPPIPDRFRLEMRLGRDGDIEEWLATDSSLQRPVLIRSLGPESTVERRREFIESVAAAAKVSHPHLAKVYAVEMVEGGAYSVSEWAGGVSLADRAVAGRVIDLEEFLPNAAGLAGALASLHAAGGIHGHIDLSAIAYSVAHPAKLGSYGRPKMTDEGGDVRALAGVLEAAVTGLPPGGPPPSDTIDGFPRALDRLLRQGQSGALSAGDLEKAFQAAPTPRVPRPEPRSTSRRLLLAAALLVVIAIGLVALGRLFAGGDTFLPELPAPVTSQDGTAPATTTTLPAAATSIGSVVSFDPYGEGGENDDLLGSLTDRNSATSWRTERYHTKLDQVKPGVGVRIDVTGSPRQLLLVGFSPGTVFEIRWAPAASPRLDDWERVIAAQSPRGTTTLSLPPRVDGHWLLWITELPEQPDGSYFATLSEVRFSP